MTDTRQPVLTMRFTTGDIGKGVALQFKKAFPENFRAYAKACQRDEVRLGSMFVFETGTLTNPRTIINFPTKHHWRGNSRIEAIDAGLKDLVHNLDVVVFESQRASDAQRVVRSREAPKMTPARAALVGLMDRYLQCLLDPFVTLLEVHKLMYFMQVRVNPSSCGSRRNGMDPMQRTCGMCCVWWKGTSSRVSLMGGTRRASRWSFFPMPSRRRRQFSTTPRPMPPGNAWSGWLRLWRGLSRPLALNCCPQCIGFLSTRVPSPRMNWLPAFMDGTPTRSASPPARSPWQRM